MDWNVPDNERTHLRELASKQADHAALPVMAERRQMWYDVNDGREGARPPFVIACWSSNEFIPQGVLRCESGVPRSIEQQLLAQTRNHGLINDDKVIRDAFDIPWFIDIDEFGVELSHESARDTAGRQAGFKFNHAITDLKKVSISRWCDQNFMADALRGTETVFSRKPSPNFLSVDRTLDEADWAAHIRETLEATRGVSVEFVMRDVTSVHGDLSKVRRAVEIARREIDCYF